MSYYSFMDDLHNTIHALPKAELHVHLRGAMPRVSLKELVKKYPPGYVWKKIGFLRRRLYGSYSNIREFLRTGDVETLFRYESFFNFLVTFGFTRHFIREADDFRFLIRSVRDYFLSQNIVYVEVTVSLIEHMKTGFNLETLVECLDDESARSEGITIRWIVDLVRNFGPRRGMMVLRNIIRMKPESIIGITLGGSEARHHPRKYKRHYEMARDAGLHTTVHAGETLGPESVRTSIELLKPERIGHGVRAVESDNILRHLAEQKIPLEVCPSSNVFLGLYPDFESVPVRRLIDAGVIVTINTDDPAFFGCSLNEELLRLIDAGFTTGEVQGMMKNAFISAFIPENERREYIRVFESALSKTNFATDRK